MKNKAVKVVDGTFLTSTEFAALAKTSRRSVERWRREKKGPPYHRVRGKVLYERDVALEWIRSQTA
jgi:hypothetical protein